LKVHSNDKRFRPILIKKINKMEGLDED
jgi:hypothetical protein